MVDTTIDISKYHNIYFRLRAQAENWKNESRLIQLVNGKSRFSTGSSFSKTGSFFKSLKEKTNTQAINWRSLTGPVNKAEQCPGKTGSV